MRLKPSRPLRIAARDLDALALELHDDDTIDFRLELGDGLAILWALPSSAGSPLRLFHVDGAAYTVDAPELLEDPFVGELASTVFLGDGAPVRSVTLVLRAQPPGYTCTVALKDRADVVLRCHP